MEQDVATLKAQLVEKQTVQTENSRLKLQLESTEAQCKVEQRKAGEERSETTQQILNTSGGFYWAKQGALYMFLIGFCIAV